MFTSRCGTAKKKDQPRAFSLIVPGNASVAAADRERNLIDQLGACMWQSDTVFSQSRACFFPRQHLRKKTSGSRDAPGFFEQTHDLPDCTRSPTRSQLQCDLPLIKNVGERDGHREKLDLFRRSSYPVNPRTVATEKTTPASKDEATISLQRSIYDPGYVNAMSHFYRGELGRIMVWRQRLDITTNWAITSSTAIITIAFSNRDVPHIIFFFNLAIVWVMLWIESRRYRFYDAFRARVRMLEAHFLVPMVMENRQMLQGEWKKLVCEDLILPSFKISKLEAIGRRLKRNYVFIFVLIMVAWVTKIFLHASEPITSGRALYHALRVGHIPSWLVAGTFIATFVSVIGITIYVGQKSSGEITEFGAHRSLWRI